MSCLEHKRGLLRMCFHAWPSIILVVILAQYTRCLDESSDETIVYPQFLEGRSEDGARILKLNDEMTLRLEQRSAFDDHLLIRTAGEDDTLIEKFVDASAINRKLFQDQHHMASAIVSEEDGLHVSGIIGDDIRIRPLLTMERTAEGHVPHLLYREKTLWGEAAVHDQVFMPRSEDPRIEGRQDVTGENSISRIKPEIHIVLDTVYYKLFGGNENDIIAYFGAVLNSVNLRYETIKDPRVTVKITGFTLNKPGYHEKYITTFGRYGYEFQKYGDMQSTLEGFKKTYMSYQPNLFAKVDVLVLVTGMEMCGFRESQLLCDVSGLAYVAGACTQYRTTIVEDKPWSYKAVRTMSHEIAHTLGCVHDGNAPDEDIEGHPGAKDCPWSDGYIMSYVQNSTKEYHFSPCCARQIKHVANLKTRACLHTNNTQKVITTTRDLPGAQTSLDQLCKTTFAYRRPDFYFDTICIRGECVPAPARKKKKEKKKKKASTGKLKNRKTPKKSKNKPKKPKTTPTTTRATTRVTLPTPPSRVLTWYSGGKWHRLIIPG
ncbi:venom metalloproteinase BumaMPs1-like isoform X2 [Ornithodoros turicata]|uniref:venom metalloproteinase BumaMPs1-like isoform X2 n=1 Tax=Ornithodoros turicata TaxID=34597 RepID=UPI00313A24FD